jgi:hypothetical protein
VQRCDAVDSNYIKCRIAAAEAGIRTKNSGPRRICPVNQKTYRKQAAQPLISGFWHENGTPEKMTIRSQVFESSVKLTFPIFFP